MCEHQMQNRRKIRIEESCRKKIPVEKRENLTKKMDPESKPKRKLLLVLSRIQPKPSNCDAPTLVLCHKVTGAKAGSAFDRGVPTGSPRRRGGRPACAAAPTTTVRGKTSAGGSVPCSPPTLWSLVARATESSSIVVLTRCVAV